MFASKGRGDTWSLSKVICSSSPSSSIFNTLLRTSPKRWDFSLYLQRLLSLQSRLIPKTNRVGLGFALAEALQNSQTPNPDSYGDSQLVIKQVTGMYKAWGKHLSKYLTQEGELRSPSYPRVGLGFASAEAPQNSQTQNPNSYGDSQLVVRKVTGTYEARRKHLSEYTSPRKVNRGYLLRRAPMEVVPSNHMSLRESQRISVHDRIGSHNTEVDNDAQRRVDVARQERDEIQAWMDATRQ
ncbi:hypothetical protein NE237_009620 [Protea cynaroides]|uniref:Uncharacterized protein n=1 Tax=Protea cynaroides TaxID=273540 RepID=A0A9Q0R0X5_9MAGN|nr:hypothetical protein NE237_009620 [Protea cynaroides]